MIIKESQKVVMSFFNHNEMTNHYQYKFLCIVHSQST